MRNIQFDTRNAGGWYKGEVLTNSVYSHRLSLILRSKLGYAKLKQPGILTNIAVNWNNNRMRPAIRKTIYYFLFLMVFTLVSMEVLLRAFKMNMSWGEKNGASFHSYYGEKHNSWLHTWTPQSVFDYKSKEFTYPYRINAMGVREKNQFFSDSLKTKIVCLGDSYTEGMGAPYDSAYPRFLENNLLSSGYNCEVYNAGVSGSDPFYEYMLYREKLASYKPDYLLLQINESDIDDYIYRGGMERFKPNGQAVFNRGPWYLPLYKWSYLVRFLCNTYPGHLQYDKFISNNEFKTTFGPRAIAAIGSLTDTVQRLARSNNCSLLVILQPIATELAYDTFVDSRVTVTLFAGLEKHMDSAGINYVNLWPPMKRKINDQNMYNFSWPENVHYNSAGYQLLATTLLEEINKKYPDFWKKLR